MSTKPYIVVGVSVENGQINLPGECARIEAKSASAAVELFLAERLESGDEREWEASVQSDAP